MKLDIVIKTKHKENMNMADTIVINASFYVWSGFICLFIAKKLFDVSDAEITAALAEFRFF